MKQEAHDADAKEVMIERFLQVSTTLQGVFDHYEILMGAISILFHHRQLSPLLVDRHAVMTEARAIQLRERNRGNVLLMNVLDVWVSRLSYVVKRNLDIIIMVHLPVGQADSYRHLYEYVKTPLSFSNESTHFFPNPVSKHLLMDKDNTSPRVISETELAACDSIKDYIRFCPGQSFELMSSPPSCLISLHQGDTTGVINECPITLLDESYVYVESLGFGDYSFYSESSVTARVLCGYVAKETVKLEGLKKVSVRRDCRLIGEEFILEPVVDYTVASKSLDSVPLTFASDQNLSLVVDWGKERGLLNSRQEEDGQTMADIAKQWDLTELEEVKDYTFMQYVGIAFGVLVGTLLTFRVARECLGCYNSRQARREMARTIGDQDRTTVDNMEMVPLTSRANPSTQSESVSNTNTARRSVAPSSVNAYCCVFFQIYMI